MRLRIRYSRAADLLADHDAQFTRRGVLVRVAPPEGLALYASVALEIVTPEGALLSTDAQVVQVAPGVGVAVTFDPASVAGLGEAIAAAREAAPGEGAPPEHAVDPPPWVAPEPEVAASEPPGEPASGDEASQPAGAGGARRAAPKPGGNDRIHLALHGNRDDRASILRDLNKQLHAYVLRNPGLQMDEVLAIAKMTTIHPEVYAEIAGRKDWLARPGVAIALVRNAKYSANEAVKLLGYVSAHDLRQLAKDPHARPMVQAAARRRLLG